MTTAVSLKLSDDERERLAVIAKKQKRSAHFLMREAVVGFLEREEMRQSFHEEAEAAWKDYKETGLHLSLQSIEAWAKSGRGELPPWEK